MIITLKGANFSSSNIGTLSTYSIRFNSNGITNTNTSVDRETNTGYTATITFKENYELNGAITVTMGGVDITSTAVSGLNINITKVTGNVVITVPAKSTVVEPEEPEEPDTPIQYTITYKYMSGSTEIKTATTEKVNAGTSMTFSTTDSRAQVSGYTCSSVSPSGQQIINSNITVTYNYTANSGTGDGDTPTAGKNLVNPNDPDWFQGRLSPATGETSDQDADKWYTTGYITVTPGVNYVASGTYSNGNRMNCTSGARWYFFSADKTYLGQTDGYFYNGGQNYISAPVNAALLRVSFQASYTLPQIEVGTTHTDYEEYKG